MLGPRLHEPRRVFIGIKLPDELAENIIDLQSAIGDAPGRFTAPEDIHLTLVPPFQTRDVLHIRYLLHRTIHAERQFPLRFVRLCGGPNKWKPRLAWIEVSACSELIALKKKLLRAFPVREKVPFVPHMTIARFLPADRETLARRPLERPLSLSMMVASVDVFESPHAGGSGYSVLASVTLQPEGGAPISHLSRPVRKRS